MTGQPVNEIAGEVWKPIPHREYGDSIYSASNLGRIKRNFTDKFGRHREYLIKPATNEKGFKKIMLALGPKSFDRASTYVSRLVMMAFKPRKDMLPLDVIFLDNDPSNCNLENLKWATRAEVFEHRKTHPEKNKLYTTKFIDPETGEVKTKLEKISDTVIRQIVKLSENHSQTTIAKKYKITQAAVSMILSGKRRRATTEIIPSNSNPDLFVSDTNHKRIIKLSKNHTYDQIAEKVGISKYKVSILLSRKPNQ